MTFIHSTVVTGQIAVNSYFVGTKRATAVDTMIFLFTSCRHKLPPMECALHVRMASDFTNRTLYGTIFHFTLM